MEFENTAAPNEATDSNNTSSGGGGADILVVEAEDIPASLDVPVQDVAPKDESSEGDRALLNQDLSYQLSLSYLQDCTLFEEIGPMQFQEQIPLHFLCSYCTFVLWYPVKIDKCGHVVCRNCFVKTVGQDGETMYECPKDLTQIPADEVIPNQELQSAIANTVVRCIESECEWSGEIQQFESHFKICGYKKLECPQCTRVVKADCVTTHMKDECENRLTPCSHCSDEVFWRSLAEHEESCIHRQVACPNGCKSEENLESVTMIKLGLLDLHLNNDCLERVVSCPFYEFGCPKNLKIKRVVSHFTKYSILHLNNICENGKINHECLEEQVRTLLSLKDRLIDNSRQLTNIKLRHGPQLLLKLGEMSSKLEALATGKASELANATFYSCFPYGYKIYVKVTITGNSAANKHLSVYISLCDSAYNALLNWPFKQKIDIHLINQKNDKHITHSIVPNPVKENFPFIQKPTNQKNPFFGIEKFAKVNIFDDPSNFIVEEVMFLKFVVEPHDIV